MLARPETFFPSGCCPTSQNLPGRLHARAHVPALSQPASLECSAASSLRPRDSSSFHDCSKAAHAAWRELSFQCARPGAGDSGATYLGGELDPVHGVLGAVVVRGAPVQVELAEPVGPAERPAPQHCGGDAGSARPARAATPGGGDAARGPVCGRRRARWPPSQNQVPGRSPTNGFSLLPYSFARFITLKTSMSHMRK